MLPYFHAPGWGGGKVRLMRAPVVAGDSKALWHAAPNSDSETPTSSDGTTSGVLLRDTTEYANVMSLSVEWPR